MHRRGWTVCVMGILLTGCILLSLSAKVLSINDDVDVVAALAGSTTRGSSTTTTSSAPSPQRMGGAGVGRANRNRISREELRQRPSSTHVQSSSTVDCDGMMQQHPPLPPAPDDALNFYTIGDWVGGGCTS
jgi:hypothetical protein